MIARCMARTPTENKEQMPRKSPNWVDSVADDIVALFVYIIAVPSRHIENLTFVVDANVDVDD
jgi:hypothetical protein